jgi:hypothetical protein
MDRRNLESYFWMPDGLTWLYKLLCHAHGRSSSSHETSFLPGSDTKEWRATSLDWKNSSDQEGSIRAFELEKAKKDIRQLYVGPFSGRSTGRIRCSRMGGYHHDGTFSILTKRPENMLHIN